MPSKSSFEHSEGSQRALKHLGTQGALGHLSTRTVLDRQSGVTCTQTLEHLVCSSTWALGHLWHSGTWELSRIRVHSRFGTWALKALGHSSTYQTCLWHLSVFQLSKRIMETCWRRKQNFFSKVCPISGKTYNEECIIEIGIHSSMFLRRFPPARIYKKMWPQITYLQLKELVLRATIAKGRTAT